MSANGAPRRRRRDFVMLQRSVFAEIRENLDFGVLGTYLMLIVEADHRTGTIRDSVRGLASRNGTVLATMQNHVRRLQDAGEVEVIPARNQHAPGEIRIVRYEELTGSRPSADQVLTNWRPDIVSADGVLPAETPPKTTRHQDYKKTNVKYLSDFPENGNPDSPIQRPGKEETQPRSKEETPVPDEWVGTGYDQLAASSFSLIRVVLNATDEECAEVSARLRTRFDAPGKNGEEHALVPTQDVVMDELSRIRVARDLPRIRSAEAEHEKRRRAEREFAAETEKEVGSRVDIFDIFGARRAEQVLEGEVVEEVQP